MAQAFGELTFTPIVDEIITYSAGSGFSVLSGSNNSSKSTYLKNIISDTSRLCIGANKFYSFHHLPFYTENDSEVEKSFQDPYKTTYN